MRNKLFGKLNSRFAFIVIGIASTVWFLIRVLPKPSRAGYPCMKAAAPIMSSFILYLLAISGSTILLKSGINYFRRQKYLYATVIMVVGLIILFANSYLSPEQTYASLKGSSPDDYPPNIPLGEGVGIHPGRVVWAWDPNATDENCTNSFSDPVRGEDGYFMEKNNNREVISRMLDDNVIKLTGATKVSAAWDSLFTDLNRRKGLGNLSYQAGQKIFIKINQGGGAWLTNAGPDDDLSFIEEKWAILRYGMAETSPLVVIETLDQLVNGYGIPEEDIFVGDPSAHIYKHNYDMMHAYFPFIKYVDRDLNHADIGRTTLTPAAEASMFYSDKGLEMPNAISDKLFLELENADYLINIASLKAHSLAGVTLSAKNHFGSHTRESAAHLHPGLVATSNDKPTRNEYGMYRVLTDIMGHESLGMNTVLFIVDGLWGAPQATEKPVKWNSAPFNGDWPNSIFASQDQVALESVCFDFLKSEYHDPDGIGLARPWMGAVDDFLHQAADKQFWPEGIVYDPENDGIPIGSLGVHEHWNNEMDKKYSQNLGNDFGIDLLQINKTHEKSVVLAREAKIKPVIDGSHIDRCWIEADWYQINQFWEPWAFEPEASDFQGKYQVSWSESENLIYYYVEILDDDYMDGYIFPDDDYQTYDLLEVYHDEDLSGGYHAFDDELQVDCNAENAFLYRIVSNTDLGSELGSDFHAVDIHGMDWGDHLIDYANHFQEFAMKRDENLLIYEFSIKVYNDTYRHENPESSRVMLKQGKEMGLAIAYADNDRDGSEPSKHIGSVWAPEDASTDLWIDADYFGIVKLLEAEIAQNNAVEVVGSVTDFKITVLGEELLIHNDLKGLFSDPDGDELEFSVHCDEELLDFKLKNNELLVIAEPGFAGKHLVTLKATDGEYEAQVEFNISFETTRVEDALVLGPGVSCFPNPFAEDLYVEFDLGSTSSSEVYLVIYNLNGQRIKSDMILLEPGVKTKHRVDGLVGSLGIYIVELKIKDKTYSRIVKKN